MSSSLLAAAGFLFLTTAGAAATAVASAAATGAAALLVFGSFLGSDGGLGGGESCDGETQRRAAHVVQADLMTEFHGRGIAAVFAADAQLDVGAGALAALDRDFHQAADAGLVERLERVRRENVHFLVLVDEAAVVVAADAEAGLREVVRPEREELGSLSDFIGGDAGTRNFDHRADEIIDGDAFFVGLSQ